MSISNLLPRWMMAASVLIALSAGRAATAAPVNRDWVKHPAIESVGSLPGGIVALGDIHGDYQRMLALLRRAGIVGLRLRQPQDADWTGGQSVLVVTGDMIDKGPHPVNVLRFLAALRESAARKGGRVVVTMGNHEAEFLAGPNEVKAKDFIDDLKRNHIDQSTLLHCQGDIGEFLCNLPFGARVGEWFFSHGGNSGGRTLEKLRLDLTSGVAADGFGAKELADPNSLLEARLGAGKIWFDPPQKGADSKKTEREILEADAAALGVRHMAQGHQPSEVTFADGVVRHVGEMFQRWGLLFLIDTGMSRGVKDSKGAFMRITADKDGHTTAVSAICANGLVTPLWDENGKAGSGRAVPCK